MILKGEINKNKVIIVADVDPVLTLGQALTLLRTLGLRAHFIFARALRSKSYLCYCTEGEMEAQGINEIALGLLAAEGWLRDPKPHALA